MMNLHIYFYFQSLIMGMEGKDSDVSIHVNLKYLDSCTFLLLQL